MNISKPIFWHQGLLLQPQHLQLSDLYQHSAQEHLNKYLIPDFWGVISMSIREDNLNTRTFGFYEGQFVFPDGTFVSFPGNSMIESRSFASHWPENKESLTVYLGLQKWKSGPQNVTMITPETDKSKIRSRFACNGDGENVSDLYLEGPEASVKRLDYALRIIWETEEDDFNDYELIAVAKLVRNGKDIQLSDKFFPPCITMQAVAELSNISRQITDQTASRCTQLESIKRTGVIKTGSSDMSDVAQFMGLRTLADIVSSLNTLATGVDIHPWFVYREFARAIGKLSVFTERIDASGKAQDGSNVLLPYNHQDLYGCFSSAQNLISFLLDEIVLGTENVVALNAQSGGLFTGELKADMNSDRYRYYLIVRTQRPAEQLRDSILTMVKLASKKNIHEVTSRFVGGVPLDYVPYPPAGIPGISGALYFHIDERSRQWGDILAEGEIALHWNNPPEDVILQIAVQRNF